MRAQAVPSNPNDAKNDFYLTYDSQTAELAGEAAWTLWIFYLEEEQEEDRAIVSFACTFRTSRSF
jgi:hypothetical protein